MMDQVVREVSIDEARPGDIDLGDMTRAWSRGMVGGCGTTDFEAWRTAVASAAPRLETGER